MKADLKFKFLQHVSQKKQDQDQGFTLIELLVVIIIIGILAAIALPSFLNQANKAKQSEARQTLGAMNKAQQAYLLENNKFVTGTSAADLQALGIGVPFKTSNYTYSAATNAGVKGVSNLAEQANPPSGKVLKPHVGIVATKEVGTTGDTSSLTVLCEGKTAQTAVTADAAQFQGDDLQCKDPFVRVGG
ncbi:MAG TPA: hypothetical protein DCY88_00055 [Cyanobacteria bacterium UBA11372]|nr:hypothetical protein [Cyanobacteria bacterium UBA11372]